MGVMTIYCRYCGEEIIGCRGIHGDWMHAKSRWEHCNEGSSEGEVRWPSLATPT